MRRLHWLIAPLLLTSCGSDDAEGPTPTAAATPAPTTSPSPTPSPTPAPTPAPSPSGYTPYAQLTGANALPTAQTSFHTNVNPPVTTGSRIFGAGDTIQYDAAARSYTVRGTTFSAGELDGNAAAGTIRYAKSNGDSLTVTQPGNASYIRSVRLQVQGSGTGAVPSSITYLTGIPTQRADIPTSGTATFTRTGVVGEAYVSANGSTTTYSLARSTLTLTIDYSNQRASGRLTIIGTPVNGGADVTLSTVDATTDLASVVSLTVVTGDYTFDTPGTLMGALFGPRGSEVGLQIYLQGQSPSGARISLIANAAAGN